MLRTERKDVETWHTLLRPRSVTLRKHCRNRQRADTALNVWLDMDTFDIDSVSRMVLLFSFTKYLKKMLLHVSGNLIIPHLEGTRVFTISWICMIDCSGSHNNRRAQLPTANARELGWRTCNCQTVGSNVVKWGSNKIEHFCYRCWNLLWATSTKVETNTNTVIWGLYVDLLFQHTTFMHHLLPV